MMQRRFFGNDALPVQLRADDGPQPKIAGYAAVFYRADDPGTEFELFRYDNYRIVERLMPSAFDRALKEDDVRALFNHDVNAVLGRMRAGTLRLAIDNVGLRYEIDAPDTQTARDLIESLKRGDVSGSSFSFDYLAKDVIQKSEADGSELDVIEVRDAKLYDVGPVTFPAYTSTTSGYRSLAEDNLALKQELEQLRLRRRQAIGKRILARVAEIDAENF